MRRAPVSLSIALAALLVSALLARAEADGPDYFRVTGVAANDVLNVRAAPDAGAARLGEIPPNADGIRSLGCQGGLSFAEWQQATEAERAAALHTRWCRVAFGGVEGWVAARYLTEGSAPATPPAADPAPSIAWPVVAVDGRTPQGMPEIGFARYGGLAGTTGCNRFTGKARIEEGALVVDAPFATTRMACPGDLDRQETKMLGILTGRIALAFDPFAGTLELSNAAGTLSLKAPLGAAQADATPPHSLQPAGGDRTDYWSVFGLEGHLNIRAEATTGAPVRTRVLPGTVLRSFGCTQAGGRRWCEVETLDGSQLRGWAAAEYLEPADSALRAGQGIFDAIGHVPCARAAGQPSSRCEFGVARDSDGTATMVVIRPDGTQRVLFFQNGTFLSADTSQADGYPETSATREADLTFVRVGTERYEIPDAVIFGG